MKMKDSFAYVAAFVLLAALSFYGCATQGGAASGGRATQSAAGADNRAVNAGFGYDGITKAVEAGGCGAAEKRIEDSSPDEIAAGGDGALFAAAMKGCDQACRMLLDRGVKPDSPNQAGETPLFAALFGGHPDIARMLFDRGADIDVVRSDGANTMYIATLGGDDKSVDMALELFHAKCEAQGKTPEEYQKMLREYLNKPEENGWTPLMNAVSNNDPDLIRKLVGLGADVNARDARGHTARFMAYFMQKPEAEKAIIELGGTN